MSNAARSAYKQQLGRTAVEHTPFIPIWQRKKWLWWKTNDLIDKKGQQTFNFWRMRATFCMFERLNQHGARSAEQYKTGVCAGVAWSRLVDTPWSTPRNPLERLGGASSVRLRASEAIAKKREVEENRNVEAETYEEISSIQPQVTVCETWRGFRVGGRKGRLIWPRQWQIY